MAVDRRPWRRPLVIVTNRRKRKLGSCSEVCVFADADDHTRDALVTRCLVVFYSRTPFAFLRETSSALSG